MPAVRPHDRPTRALVPSLAGQAAMTIVHFGAVLFLVGVFGTFAAAVMHGRMHGRDFEPIDLLAKARRVFSELNRGT